MASEWFYNAGGQKRGPVGSADLKRLADSGKPIPTQLAQSVALTMSMMAAELAIAREKENSRDQRGRVRGSAVLK